LLSAWAGASGSEGIVAVGRPTAQPLKALPGGLLHCSGGQARLGQAMGLPSAVGPPGSYSAMVIDQEASMDTRRPRHWTWAGLVLCATLYQSASCFSPDLVGQVFADQVALTAATLVRGLVGAAFGLIPA